MNWITDQNPTNNENVLVSLGWCDDVKIGYFTPFSKVWQVWMEPGDGFPDRIDEREIDGWMPFPKTIYAIRQEGEKE